MNWRKTISYLTLVIGWFLIGFFVRGLNILPINSIDKELALIGEAGQAITAQSYNTPAFSRQMTYSAIKGLLSNIDDKYAVFLDPQTAERFNLESGGQDAILGLNGEMRNGQFVVTDVLPDTCTQSMPFAERIKKRLWNC